MKKVKFKKLDAFTDGSSRGNPAGFVDLRGGEPLSPDEMQAIALGLKGFVSETGFLTQTPGGYALKYYSSECEVAFCGHATIAILYDILAGQPGAPAEVTVQVNAGELPVFNRIAAENAVYITAPRPAFLPFDLPAGRVADALGILPQEIDPLRPIRLIDGGLRTLLVPLRSLAACLNTNPDPEALRRFCLDNNADIVHIAAHETQIPGCLYRTRVFAPRFGYLEDPATGSGNAAFAYYLMDEGYWPGDFTLKQGPDPANPNRVKLKRFESGGEPRAQFGGSAVMRIEGVYWV